MSLFMHFLLAAFWGLVGQSFSNYSIKLTKPNLKFEQNLETSEF